MELRKERNMRRHIVILFLVVAVFIASDSAAQYPPEMAGTQLWMDGYCVYTTMVYTGAYNIPWSMPDIVGVEVPIGVCSELGWFLMTDLITGREYDMDWIEDCGCYALVESATVDTIKYISMTITRYSGGAWTGALRDGQLYFAAHPPQFWHFDDTYPMLTAHVNPTVIIPPVATTTMVNE
jgi:hypothetical protein